MSTSLYVKLKRIAFSNENQSTDRAAAKIAQWSYLKFDYSYTTVKNRTLNRLINLKTLIDAQL